MNHQFLRRGLCILTLSLAGTAMADDQGTLFPSNQFDSSIFGEGAAGDVNLESGPSVQYGTVSKTVVTPPAAAGGGVIAVGLKPAFKVAVNIKNLPGGGVAVTTTTRTRRVVQVTHVQHTAGGGGLQLSYFFSRYTGIALDGDLLGGSTFLSQLSGQFILRYPFDFGFKAESGYSKDDKNPKSSGGKDYKATATEVPTWGLAPYAIVGGGSQWDGRAIGFFDAGGGLELRFATHWNVFTDARWIYRNESQHFTEIRGGVGYEF